MRFELLAKILSNIRVSKFKGSSLEVRFGYSGLCDLEYIISSIYRIEMK